MKIEDFTIIFVDPKYSGNVGSLARVMKNFGFRDLRIVSDHFKTDDESYRLAMHAKDVLENARICTNFNKLLEEFNLIVGTSGVDTKSPKKFLRISKTPKEFVESINKIQGKVAILFGREDFGLLNEELEKCDVLISIPTDKEYPIMNITHSASVIFYEIFQSLKFEKYPQEIAGRIEKKKLNEFFNEILDLISYPEHKKKNTKTMFKRFIGRAVLTKWEFHILVGIFSRIIKNLKRP